MVMTKQYFSVRLGYWEVTSINKIWLYCDCRKQKTAKVARDIRNDEEER